MTPALRPFVAVLIALCSAAPVLGQDPVDLNAPLQADPDVRIGTLQNGLTYYLRGNQRPEARAELRLVVNAGSVLEDDDQQGLAHFLEHMAFNGTTHFEKQALVDYLERIGMRFGPDINAYTSFDETVYMLTVPTDVDSVFVRGFEILEDWAHGISLDAQEVEKERGVVIEEWRLGRGADARIRDTQFPVLFQGSRYAERMPIGQVDVLRTFEPAALERFYRDWYRPDLMAVVAVGDFDVDRVEDLVREHFSGMTTPAEAPERPAVPVPIHEETLIASATDAEASRAQIAVTWKLLAAGRTTTVGDYRTRLSESLHNSMVNRRMYELTQQPGAPFLFGASGKGQFVRGMDVYQLVAGVEDDAVLEGLDGLLAEAERVRRHGFVPTEFERQKTDLARGLQAAYDERETTESSQFASMYVYAYLDGGVPLSAQDQYELGLALMPTIEVSEIDRLADDWMPEQGRVVMVSGPDKPGLTLPDEPALLARFEQALAAEVAPYDDRVSDQPLVSPLPEPGAVVEEQTVADVDVTVWTLSNGVRVLLKPTDFKDDEILLSAWSPGGLSLVSDEEYQQVWLAPTLVSRGGVGAFDQIELQKQMAGQVALLGPTITSLEEGFYGQASPKDLETLFQLLYLYGTQPRADSAAVEALRVQMLGSVENRNADPRSAFGDTLQSVLAQDHPRAQPFTAERVEALDLSRSLAFYRDRFADFGDFTFTLVGAFTLEEMRPFVERYVASLPSAGRVETWQDVGIDPPEGVIEKTVRRGLEARSETQIVWAGPATYSSEQSTALGALGQALEIRLREILREDLGGTYFVRAGGSLSDRPDEEYQFALSFASDPDRADELFRVVMDEIERVREDGPSEDELAKVQEAQRRSKETALEENSYWLSRIESFDRDGRDFGGIPSFDVIDAWSVDMLREAAVRYLRPDRYVRVVLLPEPTAS